MKRFYFLLMSALFTVVTFAQTTDGADVKVDVTKTSSSSSGVAGIPWMWIIIGVVVLILIIVLASSRRGGTDVVERRNTTVIKD
jgi:hypothetical protein